MKVYRQGDVLLVEVPEAPEGKTLRRKGGKHILAYGEVTGHHHAVKTLDVKMIETPDATRFLSSLNPFELVHEEHATVQLPAGNYQIVHQREYHPAEIRRVID